MFEHREPAPATVVKDERFEAMAEALPATPSAAGGGESSVTRISSAGSVTRIAP